MNTNSSVGPKPSVNVDVPERLISVFAGGCLFLNGISKGSLLKMGLGGYLIYRGAVGHCPLYSAIGKPHLPDPVKNINIRTTVQVNRPRHEVYAFWRKLENLPLFMRHLKEVKQKDDRTSHWEAFVPGGLGTIQWDAVIVEENENSFIGWNSLPGATIENAGKVEFREIGDGWTEVHAIITYRAPLGIAGQSVSSLFTPLFEKLVRQDIKDFKRYIETGTNS
ncbi:MAG TPA: SRPBCC family protein [Flavipsychrobacter sp.]|nr:SRPBCC family protein [Flavipsychrobacter sp.]